MGPQSGTGGYVAEMVALLVIIIILIAVGILGAVIKGLLWLTLIAIILIGVTMGYGWVKRKTSANT
jgi:hypothetical protein